MNINQEAMTITRILSALAISILLVTTYAFIQQPGYDKGKGKNDKKEKTSEPQGATKGENRGVEKGGAEKGGNQGVTKGDKGTTPDQAGKELDRDYGKPRGNKVEKPGRNDQAHKVTICHKTGGHPVTISVSERAWSAHQAHGDVRGECGSSAAKGVTKALDKGITKFYVRVADADEMIFWSTDVIDLSWDRIRKARLSLAAARRSGLFTEVQLQEREAKIVLVETRTNELNNLIVVTQDKVRLSSDRADMIITKD
jgi:hypothetical protein